MVLTHQELLDKLILNARSMMTLIVQQVLTLRKTYLIVLLVV